MRDQNNKLNHHYADSCTTSTNANKMIRLAQ